MSNNELDRCLTHYYFSEHEREVEEKEIPQAQTQTQKDESSFQYDSFALLGFSRQFTDDYCRVNALLSVNAICIVWNASSTLKHEKVGWRSSVPRPTTPSFAGTPHGLSYRVIYIVHLWSKCTIQPLTIGQCWLGWSRVVVQKCLNENICFLDLLVVHKVNWFLIKR